MAITPDDYVSNETPSWAVNWSNMVFTSLNPISKIDEIYVDWAIYLNYTLEWADVSKITLSDAPTVSIYLDYYKR